MARLAKSESPSGNQVGKSPPPSAGSDIWGRPNALHPWELSPVLPLARTQPNLLILAAGLSPRFPHPPFPTLLSGFPTLSSLRRYRVPLPSLPTPHPAMARPSGGRHQPHFRPIRQLSRHVYLHFSSSLLFPTSLPAVTLRWVPSLPPHGNSHPHFGSTGKSRLQPIGHADF